jgi:hypothetical protein
LPTENSSSLLWQTEQLSPSELVIATVWAAAGIDTWQPVQADAIAGIG